MISPQDTLSLKLLAAGIITWFFSQILKSIIASIKNKRLEFDALFVLGGMPSSHTATAVALTTSIFYVQGFSLLFVVGIFMTLLIVIDVTTVRWSVLEHTRRINLIMTSFYGKSKIKLIREFKGHTYPEVIAGAIIGFLISTIVFL